VLNVCTFVIFGIVVGGFGVAIGSILGPVGAIVGGLGAFIFGGWLSVKIFSTIADKGVSFFRALATTAAERGEAKREEMERKKNE
jgi:hypothetical protein